MSASLSRDTSHASRASRLGFFIAGFGLAVWAPLVPYVRERISMSDATFGLMLLCVGIGSLTCMPLSSGLVARLGIRNVALSCIALLLIALATLANTQSLWLLGTALFAFGASLGVLDVVLNIQSLLLEKVTGKRLLSNFHGMFSVGTLAGALVLTSCLSVGFTSSSAVWLMIGLIGSITWIARSGFLQEKSAKQNQRFIRPKGLVLAVGLMCFVVYLAEGAILDWSALYLTHDKAMNTAHAGLGYTSFALMVAIARFTGDSFATQLGSQRVIIIGSLVACFGVTLSVLSPSWPLTLVGYALCGLGCANISPLLISSLNKQTMLSVSDAVTAATTIGFAGVLAGPAIMGVIAHYSSLGWAFLSIAILLALLIPFSRQLP